jgi:uncharacterized phage protein (TIGR01671 family)
MREIKFRVFYKDLAKMYYKSGLVVWRNSIIDEGDMIPMQYTGLKDSSGKEIYESDLVKVQFRTGTYIIKYNESLCAFALAENDFNWQHNVGHIIFGDVNDNYDEIEVIGNIHENKELLK